MLRKVGRKATFYMLKYVKNNCKGGKIWIAQEVIIPGISEPPVRTLRATIPENERHIFR